jgi:hypothetical protein
MYAGGVEERKSSIGLGNQQPNFGATENDPPGTGICQAREDAQVFRLRGWYDLSKYQFVINDPVHNFPIGAIR